MTYPLRGSSTLEILIAFAILTLSLTAVISVVFGNSSVTLDTETNTEAMALAKEALEDARADATTDYLSVDSTAYTETSGAQEYEVSLAVEDITPCKKVATSTVSWNQGLYTIRPQAITFSTILTDVAGALAQGGDCFLTAPDGWTNPERFASDTFNPGKPNVLDALNRIVYIGVDKAPYLAVADTRSATLGQTSGLVVSYANGFDLDTVIYSLDAFEWINPSTGEEKVYVFLATASTTAQLMVVDMTDFTNPVLVAKRGLSGCVTGSYPQGWFVYAYDDRLYLSTRETAGPEFHVFDISTPASPSELAIGSASCRGYSLNSTIEQFVVRDQSSGGTTKRYAFMATDQNSREIRVLDVTNPLSIIETTSVDISGNTDGASIYLVGSKLYFGRLAVSGSSPELYVYSAKSPASGLTLLGSRDIGAGVLGIRVAGNLAFLATAKTNEEFQVWNVKNVTSITNTAIYNFGNVVGQGIDYEPDYIYVTGQATPNFQMLYSAP